MSRPPLTIGAWGEIRIYVAKIDGNGKPIKYRAVAYFRDFNGKVKQFERIGRTKSAARASLLTKMKNHSAGGRASEITSQQRFREAAKIWIERFSSLVEDGSRSIGSLQTYERQLENHVLPALGDIRLCEIDTPLLDKHIRQIKNDTSASTAKSCRSVISGILKLAVRFGAIKVNPVREIEYLEDRRRAREPRALSEHERSAWLAQLEADGQAVRKDLPDLTRFMLATGARIGEALATLWSDIDLEAGIVQITSTIVRVKGIGLVRVKAKSKAGERALKLPSWALEMLKRRCPPSQQTNTPVFSNSHGGFRDPSNTQRDLREARGTGEFSWLVSHHFRKTTATILDDASFSARTVADQLGHAKPSMTQDVYLARKVVNPAVASALEDIFGLSTESHGVSHGEETESEVDQPPRSAEMLPRLDSNQ